MRHNKRGQLTVFIIIGIVLLFSAALIIYIRGAVTRYQPPTEVPFEQVPTELQPLQNYVTECLRTTSIDALKRTGLQGGYTDISTFRVIDSDPSQGNAVSFSPGSDLKIPYWWYLKSGNRCEGNCEFGSERPDLPEIERQLGNFISSRIIGCLGDYQTFIQQGFSIEQGPITTDVKLGRTVTVFMRYEMKVTRQGRTGTLTQFASQIPVDFQRLYELATAMTDSEIQYHFLERQTINLISDFAGINKPLPPLTDAAFDPGNSPYWLKSQVKENVQLALTSYIPALQLYGSTNFVQPPSSGPQRGIYEAMVLPIVDQQQQPFYGLSSKIIYFDWWPIYFNIKGRGVSGEFITAETASTSLISWMGIKRYSNYYDVSYPVVIELKDPKALDNEGYTFMFALEANVRDSRELYSTYQGLPVSPFTEGSLLCNYNQRISGNITINSREAVSNSPLEGVQITYSCGDEACGMGYTEGKNATLRTKFPICAGGSVIASKRNYRAAPIRYNSEIGKSGTINVSLYPQKEKKIIVRKYYIYKRCLGTEIEGNAFTTYHPLASAELSGIRSLEESLREEQTGYLSTEKQRVGETDLSCYWYFNPQDASLLNNEMAVITFTKTKDYPGEEEYIVAAIYNGNQTYTAVPLVPGKYEVNINLLYNLPAYGHNTLTIAGRTITTDTNSFLPGGKEDITLDPIVFDKAVPEGGAQLDSVNSYWELSSNNLYNDDAMVFYVLNAPKFNVQSNGTLDIWHEDLGQVGKISDYSNLLRNLLEPTTSR